MRVSKRMASATLGLLGWAVCIGLGVSHAQSPPAEPALPPGVPAKAVYVGLDSGPISNPEAQQASIYETVVDDSEATWIRVYFGPQTHIQPGGTLRITSLVDGASQLLDADSLQQWRHTSAYFNGSAVQIELLAAPGSAGNRVKVTYLVAGIPGATAESICGTDDRALSNDPRAARLGAGCTAWLVNECFLSAGHCMVDTSAIVEFNVPLSDENGNLKHPSPADQYSMDPDSVQFTDNGIGDDWAYFAVFPNSNTGLTPVASQSARHVLAANVPEVGSQTIRITGFGSDFAPLAYNQVQQSDSGPYREFDGTVVRYETDTIGGTSGSAVLDEATGKAIGIHTHAGCDPDPPPYNQGTGLNNPGLQLALRNPTGSCAAQSACNDDGQCQAGEDCYNCPGDCSYSPPNDEATCGNDVCEIANGEDCLNCPGDCRGKLNGNPANHYCCGDTVGCEDERCFGGGNTCSETLASGIGFCCGDGTCEGAEDAGSCANDCTTTCMSDVDCQAANDCVEASCVDGACLFTPVMDGTSCAEQPSGCCSAGICVAPACGSDGECDDGDACSDDVCDQAGTCSATCIHDFDPACCVATHNKEKGPRCTDGLDNDCDGSVDGDDLDCQ